MKSFRLADEKINRARKILGTKTDTATIEAALDMGYFERNCWRGLKPWLGWI
jgi:hypothetical protein